MIRIGLGYDVHAFADHRPLVIGGVDIPHTHGLLGHSDADVLTHAICDAFLGALALGSIGDWFPDTDPQYNNANSMDLLKQVYAAVQDRGYRLGNLDSVIIAQTPIFSPHIAAIQASLANALNDKVHAIGVKATTTEWLGFVGRKEGIAAHASVLLTAS